jgi:hypothetical protein
MAIMLVVIIILMLRKDEWAICRRETTGMAHD